VKLLPSRFSRRRHDTSAAGAELTPEQARAAEQQCREVLRQLCPQAPFDKTTFLQHVGFLAGGPIYDGVLPDSWARMLASQQGAHTSALTLSQYDGWVVYVNPYSNVPDVLNFGHEAGHVLFDAPKGDGEPPSGDRLVLPPVDSPEAERLLARSYARNGGFKGLKESRAERFGSMLKAQIEGLGGQPIEQDGSLSSLFRAGDV
jgi:hypothetical protein